MQDYQIRVGIYRPLFLDTLFLVLVHVTGGRKTDEDFIDTWQCQAAGKRLASEDISLTLEKLGHEVEEFREVLEPGFLDDGKIGEVVSSIEAHRIELVISIYFVMNAAMAAYKKGIKYVSVIWDAPYLGVYNPLARIDNVYISTFDRLERDRFLEHGIRHVLYQPLCVNRDSVEKWDNDIQDTLHNGYFHGISFVGRLYDNNEYDRRRTRFPVPYRNISQVFLRRRLSGGTASTGYTEAPAMRSGNILNW